MICYKFLSCLLLSSCWGIIFATPPANYDTDVVAQHKDRILVVWNFHDEVNNVSLDKLLNGMNGSYSFFVASMDPYVKGNIDRNRGCRSKFWPAPFTDILTGAKLIYLALESLICSNREAYHRIPTGLFSDPFWLDFNIESLSVTSLYVDGIKSPEPHIDSLTNLLRDADYVFVAESAEQWEVTQSGKNLSASAELVYKLIRILPPHERPSFSTLNQPFETFRDTPGLLADSIAYSLQLSKESEVRAGNWKQKNLRDYFDSQRRYRRTACSTPGTNIEGKAGSINDDETIERRFHRHNALARCNWGINTTFDASTNELILTVAQSAHGLWLSGSLPDPCGGITGDDSKSSSTSRTASRPSNVGAYTNNTTAENERTNSAGESRRHSNGHGHGHNECRCDRLSDVDRMVAASLTLPVPVPTEALGAAGVAAGVGAGVGAGVAVGIEAEFAHGGGLDSQLSGSTNTTTASEIESSGETSSVGSSNDILRSSHLSSSALSVRHVSVRIMCMTYTITPYHEAVRNIRTTWGKRCDGYLAFSNSSDLDLSIFRIVSQRHTWKEEYYEIWAKVQAVWKLAASVLLPHYDYFLIGGDDLYVIVDNLREYLASDEILSLSGYGTEPLYLGRPLRQNKLITYNSGGAGYVLNAPAVATLYPLLDTLDCLPGLSTHMEDVMVGRCLRVAGIRTVDTSDNDHREDEEKENNDEEDRHSHSRERFHPQSPSGAYWANDTTLMYTAVNYVGREHCCSRSSITFQDIRGWPDYMPCLHSEIYRRREKEKNESES
jgi:hypothetical protein